MLEAAGLSPTEVADWAKSAPPGDAAYPAAAQATSDFLTRGEELLRRLPLRPDRNEAEADAAAELRTTLDEVRSGFLHAHAADLYAALTDDLRRAVRDEDLVYAAAGLVPGLVPTRKEMAAEQARALPDKEGVEIAQGLFFSHVLASPRCGAHLVWAMLRPTGEALARLGHKVEWWPDWTWLAGAVCTIVADQQTGVLKGGADPRRPSYAVGL